MLQVGEQLPDFHVKNQDGKDIHSQDLKGKKLIMFFYPKANTPGCTAEACHINENIELLKSQGYEIFGVSADPEKNQKKFSEKFGFQYDLLCDVDKEICEAFGVWQLKKFMGREFMGIVRTTFIFDENAVCTHVIEKVDTKNAAKQILEIVS